MAGSIGGGEQAFTAPGPGDWALRVLKSAPPVPELGFLATLVLSALLGCFLAFRVRGDASSS